MQFTTPVPIPAALNKINYDSQILSIGSCFAENIADKFDYYKLPNNANPFGILFHPLAINQIIQRAVGQTPFTEQDIFFHNERWHCFDAHSDLSSGNKEELLQNLNTLLESTALQIAQASHIIITYGTAWVYRHKENKAVVANCHKLPQAQFEKELLSIGSIEQAIEQTVASIQTLNPEAHLIFTISPVRHIKDGFPENQRSKAHLIAALHEIINHKSKIINYFPSYEIMMDELRDYRFYGQDMLHPSGVAVDYIWERFAGVWIAEDVFGVMEEVSSIQKALQHRAFNEDSEGHRQFLSKLGDRIGVLHKQFPFIKF